MGAATVEVVGEGGEYYQAGSYVGDYITDDLPSTPLGYYLFIWTVWQSQFHQNPLVEAPSGKGARWAVIKSGQGSDPGGLGRMTTVIAMTVAPLQVGPMAIPSRAQDEAGNIVAANFLEISYALLRVRNVPMTNDGLDAIIQTQGFGHYSSDVAANTAIVPNQVAAAGNIVIAGFGGDSNGTILDWPYQALTQRSFYGSGDETGNGTWFGYHQRTTIRWGAAVQSGAAVELGYRRKPWLRQRQRKDI